MDLLPHGGELGEWCAERKLLVDDRVGNDRIGNESDRQRGEA
jgi:hypothetical protein